MFYYFVFCLGREGKGRDRRFCTAVFCKKNRGLHVCVIGVPVDMDISMDIYGKSVDMNMDMDKKFHIHGKPGFNASHSLNC